MVVDYQCIMPSIVDVAKCYHTKIISTSDKAKFTGATHVSFDPEHGAEIADRIVRMAIEAYPDRNHGRVRIPGQPVKMMGGFSVEAILRRPWRHSQAVSSTPSPPVPSGVLSQSSAATTPSSLRTSSTLSCTRRLIENDILVLVTGCAAVANGKSGHMVPEAAAMAGPGLRAVCESLGIPPVLHVGSCVDNSRIMVLVAALGRLPRRRHRPVARGRCGTRVVLRESRRHRGLRRGLGRHDRPRGATSGVRQPARGRPVGQRARRCRGATFVVEPDPAKAALFIRRHIEPSVQGLGLPFVNPEQLGIDDNESPHTVPVGARSGPEPCVTPAVATTNRPRARPRTMPTGAASGSSLSARAAWASRH